MAESVDSCESSSTPECDTESSSDVVASAVRALDDTTIERMLLRHFRRPFRQFRLKQTDFEEELGRKFNADSDMEIILNYMHRHCFFLKSADFLDLDMSNLEVEDVGSLLQILNPVPVIEFRRVVLPAHFFELLNHNRPHMLIHEFVIQGLTFDPDEARELLDFIAKSKTMRRLAVIGCGIDVKFFATLVNAINQSSTIKEFECSEMVVDLKPNTVSEVTYIVARLIWEREFEELKLRSCGLFDTDVRYLCELLGSDDCHLHCLDLSHNFLSMECVQLLLDAIQRSNRLTKLNLAGNNLGSHGGELINRYLYRCTSMRHLDLQYNNIGHETMNALINTLVNLPFLETVRIYGNEFSVKTATLLRRKIQKHREFASAVDVCILHDSALDQYVVMPK